MAIPSFFRASRESETRDLVAPYFKDSSQTELHRQRYKAIAQLDSGARELYENLQHQLRAARQDAIVSARHSDHLPLAEAINAINSFCKKHGLETVQENVNIHRMLATATAGNSERFSQQPGM